MINLSENEELFQAEKLALDEACVFSITDIEGKIRYVNKHFCQHSQYTPEELVGKTHRIVNSGMHSKEFFATFWQTILNGKSWEGEICNRKKDGSFYWVKSKILPIQSKDNKKPQGFIAVDFDITAQKESEQLLTEANREIKDYQDALDQSAIVAITEPNGIIKYVNDKFCEISKYEREELIGQDHRLLNSGFHGREFFVDMWRTIAKGQIWKAEIKNTNKEGNFYWVDTTIIPFMDHKGKIEKYLAIRFDITEKKSIESQIEEERARLLNSEKMASLGELAAGIAHELGNPIASIRSWIQVVSSQLERDQFDKQIFQKNVLSISSKIEDMTKIIRGMLTYARDGSQDPLELTALLTIVNDAIEYCNVKAKKRGIQIIVNPMPSHAQINCRSTEILQIIVNLVNNALDACRDVPQGQVEISYQTDGKTVSLLVQDNGPGIPSTARHKILDPFFTTKPVGKGTGLGLSISAAIAKSHGGELRVQSFENPTIFALELPSPTRRTK